MSEDQWLADAALGEYLPEWSISQEAYQPADIGSMSSNISLLKNKLGLVDDWVLAILNGTFDYSLLEPETSFDEAAPDTATSDVYRNSGKYDILFQALDEAETPKAAALAQFFAETGEKVDETLEKGPPRYMDLVAMAEKVAGEVYAKSAFETRRDSAAAVKSEMAKTLEAAGLSSELTQDSYFSDSIDEDREGLAQVAAELQKASALSSNPLDTTGGEFESDVNPYMAEYIATLNRDEPGGSEEGIAATPQSGANSEARADVQNNGVGGPDDLPREAPTVRPPGQAFPDQVQQGIPGMRPPEPMPSLDELRDQVVTSVPPTTVPSPQVDGLPPFGAQPPASLMPGLQQFAEEMEARKAGGVLGGVVGGVAPNPSQDMQVPFNPETHYRSDSPYEFPNLEGTPDGLPAFNGPRGGTPRNDAPSDDTSGEMVDDSLLTRALNSSGSTMGVAELGRQLGLMDEFEGMDLSGVGDAIGRAPGNYVDLLRKNAGPFSGLVDGGLGLLGRVMDGAVPNSAAADSVASIGNYFDMAAGAFRSPQQIGDGDDGGDDASSNSKNESWRGDPRDKRSQVGKAADWDYRKKLFDESAERRRSIASKENTRRIGATNDAVRRHVGQEFLTNLEQQRIDRARAAGGSIQQDMLLSRLLGLPRA
jgi:hypothetical protein